jgi:hypothetical protein
VTTILLALALLATDGDGLRFEGSVAAGGGYDSSLLIAPGTGAAGSAVASVSASGGAAIDLSDGAFLYVGALLDSAKFPTLTELDRTAAGASASLLVDVVGPLALIVSPSAAWSWYADPARSGASFTGRVSLRLRAARWLTLRTGYAHVLRTAADPVYATNLDRIFGEVEFRLAQETWISLAAFAERGDATFYQELPPGTSTATELVTFVPYRAMATTVGAGVGFEQGLGAGFSVDLGASWRRMETPDGPSSGPAASASVTWRWGS